MSGSGVEAGFEQWSVFEKLRKNNRMYHNEVYQTLASVLQERSHPELRMLDLGCADASDIARVLAPCTIAEYIGIDNVPAVLDQARTNLASLSCQQRFIDGDYLAGLERVAGPIDVIWLGLFLHHLPSEQKRDFFQRAIQLLSPNGILLTHDPILEASESQEAFLERIAGRAKAYWEEFSPSEQEVLFRHWAHHGHQESCASLKEMALEAGFEQMEILFRSPDNVYALLAFYPSSGACK